MSVTTNKCCHLCNKKVRINLDPMWKNDFSLYKNGHEGVQGFYVNTPSCTVLREKPFFVTSEPLYISTRF